MYLHTQQLINEIVVDEPDPAAANALQEGLGGQFGEMRTMMQYLFQSMNFRGDATSKPYKDLRRRRDCARQRWPFGQFDLTGAGGFLGWDGCPATSSACGIRIL